MNHVVEKNTIRETLLEIISSLERKLYSVVVIFEKQKDIPSDIRIFLIDRFRSYVKILKKIKNYYHEIDMELSKTNVDRNQLFRISKLILESNYFILNDSDELRQQISTGKSNKYQKETLH